MSPKIFSLLIFFLFTLTDSTRGNTNSQHVPIQAIEFQGLKNITSEQVSPHLPIKIGQPFHSQNIDSTLKALYATGFFDTIKLLEDAGTIIIKVKERPVIKQITIHQQAKLPNTLLDQLLERSHIQVGEFFSESAFKACMQELHSFYNMQGQYQNTISTKSILSKHKDQINLEIHLPPQKGALKFADIYIMGNQAFSKEKLLSQLPVTNNIWKALWNNKTVICHPTTQQMALEELKKFYQSKGYFDAEIKTKHTSMTPDQKAAYWIIEAKEGPVYRIGNYKILGPHSLSEQALKDLIHFKRDQVYSKESILKTEKAIQDKLGYFSKVETIPSVNQKNATIDLTLRIDPGKAMYVRQLHIVGNQYIQNKTIRRLCQQQEAALFSMEAIKASENRLNRAGFSKAPISILPTPVSNTKDDQVDLILKIDENTGPMKLIPGQFSFGDKQFTFSMLAAMDNILGSGIKSEIQASKIAKDYALSILYDNPYSTLDGIQKTFKFVLRSHNPSILLSEKIKNLYQQSNWVKNRTLFEDDPDPSILLSEKIKNLYQQSNWVKNRTIFEDDPANVASVVALNTDTETKVDQEDTNKEKSSTIKLPEYNMNELSVMLKYGIPISRSNHFWIFKFEPKMFELRFLAKLGSQSEELKSFIDQYGKNFLQIPLTTGLDVFHIKGSPFPEKGFYNKLKFTISSLWAEKWYWYPYCKFDINGAVYQRYKMSVNQEMNFGLRWKIGYGFSFKDDDTGLPFFENYHSGQTRGFAFNSFGKKDSLGQQLGGNFLFNGSLILAAAKPFRGDNFRLSLFCDIGAVETIQSIQQLLNESSPKLSVGVALDTVIPLPVLGDTAFNINIARPIWYNAEGKDKDTKQPLSFTLGSSFL